MQEYTRQRQGRDFSILAQLRNTETSAERNYNNTGVIIGNTDPKDDGEQKKSLLQQLEQCKEEAERNAVPIDGHEPVEKGSR